jgi:hypothetical protein
VPRPERVPVIYYKLHGQLITELVKFKINQAEA